MFDKLKRKLLMVNMLITSIVMILSFTVIYLFTFNNLHLENIDKLQSIPAGANGLIRESATGFMGRAQNNSLNPNKSTPGEDKESDNDKIPVEYSQAFSIEANEKTGEYIIYSFFDLPESTYTQLLKKASTMDADYKVLTVNKSKYMFKKTDIKEDFPGWDEQNIEDGSHVYYTFLDVTESSKNLRTMLVILSVVGVLMLFTIYGISLYFANRSIRPISEAWEKQRTFIADASHELKTPLAVINANTDVLRINEDETIKSQEKWLNYISYETERLNKLINDMLYLAKTDDDTHENISVPSNVSTALEEILLSLEAYTFEKGITMDIQIMPDIVKNTNIERLQQVFLILLDNAIKYTDQGGNIVVSLVKERNTLTFTVTNSGKGIPKDKLPNIFDRFYRVDESRSSGEKSYGLGLSIAKSIVERLGGTITVISEENKYTTFTVIIK